MNEACYRNRIAVIFVKFLMKNYCEKSDCAAMMAAPEASPLKTVWFTPARRHRLGYFIALQRVKRMGCIFLISLVHGLQHHLCHGKLC
jgi:hypothetical protein